MVRKHLIVAGILLAAYGCAQGAPEIGQSSSELLGAGDLDPQLNIAGFARSTHSSGDIDRSNPFFQELGTNGRTCETCHMADQGWSVVPLGIKLRFLSTDGLDPIFRPHDGANAPNLDVSTPAARWSAYSLLLNRGLIRIGRPMPAGAEFELLSVDDPYGFATAAQLSLYRRVPSIANVAYLGAINWDGRSTIPSDPTNIRQGLKNQSNGATVNHAQASPIDDATRDLIVDFETQLFFTQTATWYAGNLSALGASGNPESIMSLPFVVGMNTNPSFDPNVFSTFLPWSAAFLQHRRVVEDGQVVFNTKTFGPNNGTCSGCHNIPAIGGRSNAVFFDVGISDPARRTADVPLYTFRNLTTGDVMSTTDPGRGLITGRWSDLNRFKAPALRGLAARPPYFHDGSEATLDDVVEHYDEHFNIGLTAYEHHALVRFLESL